MINPISPTKIFVAIIALFFTTTTFAEYYIVYPGSYAGCGRSPCKVYKKKYKRSCHRYKTYKVKKKRSRGCIVKYNVYPQCNGAYWVPACQYAWGGQPCGPSCRDFYVPPEYFYRSRYYDSYSYDPAMDWDMRTMDDY
jgi:hypothetical protein